MTDQPITYNPRAWATYSRDAKCGCTAPDPADCAIPHQPGPWMCPCHYLSATPTAEELAAVRSEPAPASPSERLLAAVAKVNAGAPPLAMQMVRDIYQYLAHSDDDAARTRETVLRIINGGTQQTEGGTS